MTTSDADLTWVQRVQTVNAIDFIEVDRLNEDPAWRLIGIGKDAPGLTTLTYGWPWPEAPTTDKEPIESRRRRELESLIPSVGEIWHWEPMRSHASQRLVVLDTKINEDGEVWIQSGHALGLGRNTEPGSETWNELGRWMQACVLVKPAEGDE